MNAAEQVQAAGAVWADNAEHADPCGYHGWMPVLVSAAELERLVESLEPLADEATLPGRVVCPSCGTVTRLPAATRHPLADPFASRPARARRGVIR